MMNNEQSTDFEAVSAEAQELQMEATETLEDTVPEKEETVNPAAKEKSGFSKKKIMRFFCQQAYIGLSSNINFKLVFFLP